MNIFNWIRDKALGPEPEKEKAVKEVPDKDVIKAVKRYQGYITNEKAYGDAAKEEKSKLIEYLKTFYDRSTCIKGRPIFKYGIDSSYTVECYFVVADKLVILTTTRDLYCDNTFDIEVCDIVKEFKDEQTISE